MCAQVHLEVLGPSDARLCNAHVVRVLDEILVVCAHVQHHRQAARCMSVCHGVTLIAFAKWGNEEEA